MDGYEIVPYRSEFFEQVAKVMIPLWGKHDDAHREEYFKWKYYNNPYVDKPLGIMALHNNIVVGFRGYLAQTWYIKNEELKVLVAGDTCIAEKHRRKGLSVAMGYAAMDEYASEYRIFLNFAGTSASKRGYERLGFFPLVDKYKLERYAHRDDFQDSVFTKSEYIATGMYGNILVTATPEIQGMFDLVSKNTDESIFSLAQNKEFFEWRFKNKKNKYIFCYHTENNIITDYVVFGTGNKFKTGRIVDYTENNIEAFKKIIQQSLDQTWFDKLVIGNYSLSKMFAECLRDFGFKPNVEFHKAIIPLWVRPTKKDFREKDWYIRGLDIRNIKNWKMKGVCTEWL